MAKKPEPADSLGLRGMARKARKRLGNARKEMRRRANRDARWEF